MKKYQIPQISTEEIHGTLNLLKDSGDQDMGKMGDSATGGINNPGGKNAPGRLF